MQHATWLRELQALIPMAYSFLHSSDLHLGRAYGGFPETIRGRLRGARHRVIARLAQAARQVGTGHLLLAGDTFDAETPSPETLRHALRAMAAEAICSGSCCPAITTAWPHPNSGAGSARMVSAVSTPPSASGPDHLIGGA